jgi:hypothetical protein
MNMDTRIDLMPRISLEALQRRWSSHGKIPNDLALSLILDGRLKVQLLGTLRRSRQGTDENQWQTLLPRPAYEILAGKGSDLIPKLRIGCWADDLFIGSDSSSSSTGERIWFKLFEIPDGPWQPAYGIDKRNLGILTSDILTVEATFGVPANDIGGAGAAHDQQEKVETRGNNFAVQFNILEAALITMVAAIKDGSASEYLHGAGKHEGLNVSKLAAEIDDHRNRFKLLCLDSSELEPPRGTARERIQKLLGKAMKQEFSGDLFESSAKKKHDRST